MFTRVCKLQVQSVLGVPFSAARIENAPLTLQGNNFLALKAVFSPEKHLLVKILEY